MLVRLLLPMRITLVALACGCGLASSPGPPTKATAAQIDQMNQEIGAGSSSAEAVPNWAALAKAIREATDSVDRMHWISEFAHHTAALPESLRTQRLTELRQLMREVR